MELLLIAYLVKLKFQLILNNKFHIFPIFCILHIGNKITRERLPFFRQKKFPTSIELVGIFMKYLW
jgi:hypothetical protein